MIDLKFISGNFLYDDLPPDKAYLRQYFTTRIEIRFLVYYVELIDLYRSVSFPYFLQNFIDHTGTQCSRRWMQIMLRRVKTIERELASATKNADLDKVSEIKSGNFMLIR